jgi:alkyl sulfatase BDS1-like metallo-beta-lactamase superfamily hydrolase
MGWRHKAAALALLVAALAAQMGVAAAGTAPSASTRAAHAAMRPLLEADDQQDFERAGRGFIATWDAPEIPRDDGTGPAWSFAAIDGIRGPAPETVNPSLWRQSLLLARHGLFRVTDRVYQVRGFDLSVMTIILGDTGFIIVDPLTTTETARAALALARRHLGDRPVRAIIYTHSHVDHFGGILGVVSRAEVARGEVPVIAPEGFLEHAVAENVLAGNAMGRRALFQFGAPLPVGALGRVSMGIGPALPTGTVALVPPTDIVTRTGETRRLDGVEIDFQLTPGTEAPAEMNFHIPAERVLCLAENASPTMHNILTPRGALVRDAKLWADYLTESLRRYGDRSDVLIHVHGWPRWGRDEVRAFIESHRDAYKFLHDQSVRLMNRGLVGAEIAETLELPEPLARQWFNRGYYGTMRHNSKAVYQRYMGWYSGNPADLDPHPPVAMARRMVRAMGGAGAVLRQAEAAMRAGDERWAATLLDHLVKAEPGNRTARLRLAEAYRQLGWRAESSLWRNIYLTGAHELESGRATPFAGAMAADFLAAMPTAMLLDALAVRLVPERAQEEPFTLALVLSDTGERHHIRIANGVMVHETGVSDPADATLTLPRSAFLMALGRRGLPAADQVRVEGRVQLVPRFLSLFETPPADFPIVWRD